MVRQIMQVFVFMGSLIAAEQPAVKGQEEFVVAKMQSAFEASGRMCLAGYRRPDACDRDSFACLDLHHSHSLESGVDSVLFPPQLAARGALNKNKAQSG